MRPLALKWRLSILVALAIAAAMAVICTLVYKEVRELVQRQMDQSLLSTANAIGAILSDPALKTDPQTEIEHVLAATAKGPPALARVWSEDRADGALVVGAAATQEALEEQIRKLPVPPEDRAVWFNLTSREGDYRVLWLRTRAPTGPVSIAVVRSTGTLSAELRELLGNMMLITVLVVAGAVVAVVVLVIVGLRPIHRTAEGLLSVTASNLGQVELSSRKVPAELTPFVESVTQMLVRLDVAMHRQKAFIADAAHELRTPITVAKSTLQVALARKDRSAEEYRQALAETAEDLRRLERLVDELLTLARLDETPDQTQVQPVDLAQLLADLAGTFSPQVARAGGKLDCRLVPACVRGDHGQLERLFANLLDNALRHGPAGGAIELRMATGEAGRVAVTVRDQGGRIPPEDLPRLFDRFYRADGSRSQSTGGAGLGLAIAKEIVSRHGGDIHIDSEPAAGTCVRVSLPACPAAAE